MAGATSAGMLNRRVTIEQVTSTRDEVGGQVETWSTLVTVWAEVRQKSASERFYRQQVAAQATHTITIRWRADITTKHRVVYNGRRFVIRGVTDVDDGRQWMDLACEEIIAP